MTDTFKIICPICGDIMTEYSYDYNTFSDEKINYTCSNCGHKESRIRGSHKHHD